jgi:ubiquinone biosynthesis protein UbiJ
MPATPVWLAAVESVLNRSIGQSMHATAAAGRLNQTSIDIAIEGLSPIRAAVTASRLVLKAAGEGTADAAIRGSPPAFLKLLAEGAGMPPKLDPRASVQVSGDAEVAAGYRDLFALARPDLEEELSRLIGDLPARRFSLIASSAFAWARKAARTAGENLAEYLQEESRDLVTKPELEEFLEGVDRVREAADRIEARLAHAEQRLKDTT